MTVKLSQLRIFVAVAEMRNIQDAGERVGRSPSAVSIALKQLETDIGAPLFETDRKSTLSSVGRFVFEEARAELTRHDRMMHEIKAYADGNLGRVAIACVPSVATQILPGVLERFIRLKPGVELDVRDIDTAAVIRAIERGTVDIGIAGMPADTRNIEFSPWFRDELVLVCASNHPLSKNPEVTWHGLEGQNVIANGVMETLSTTGLSFTNGSSNLMVRNNTSLLALVRNGVGVTVLPRLSVPEPIEGIRTVAIHGPKETRLVGILSRSDATPPPAVYEFINNLEGWAKEQKANRNLAIEFVGSPQLKRKAN